VCAEFVQSQPQEWSDEETLLLLDGLELHKDRWADIAEHVGTKSQVQCILHFLQLPIEDEFLDELESRDGQPAGVIRSAQDADKQDGAAQDTLIPFADTGNPVLSQVCTPMSYVCLYEYQLQKQICLYVSALNSQQQAESCGATTASTGKFALWVCCITWSA